jgi:hypothetical protein
MEAHIQTFRHSFGKVALMVLGGGFIGLLAFTAGQLDYFLLAIAGILPVVALFYATSSVKISEAEITTTRLLGSKSLRWSEIARISTLSQSLRLHNYDDDLVLFLDSQLDGYPDILNIVFSKRPDLLDRNDDRVMSMSWLAVISSLSAGLLIIAIAVFQFLATEDVGKIFSLVFLVAGLSIVVKWFLSPKRITLDNKDLIVGYWFKEVSCSAREISFVSLEKQRTRNG